MSKMAGPDVQIDWVGGHCPVNAEGTVDGKPFFFKARGRHWSMGIGGADPELEPDWSMREEWPGGQFDAGWMTEDDARGCIDKAVAAYAGRDKE